MQEEYLQHGFQVINRYENLHVYIKITLNINQNIYGYYRYAGHCTRRTQPYQTAVMQAYMTEDINKYACTISDIIHLNGILLTTIT